MVRSIFFGFLMVFSFAFGSIRDLFWAEHMENNMRKVLADKKYKAFECSMSLSSNRALTERIFADTADQAEILVLNKSSLNLVTHKGITAIAMPRSREYMT